MTRGCHVDLDALYSYKDLQSKMTGGRWLIRIQDGSDKKAAIMIDIYCYSRLPFKNTNRTFTIAVSIVFVLVAAITTAPMTYAWIE